MPSLVGLDEKQQLDFVDPEYVTATVKLARLVGDVMTSVYNRNQMQPFLRNVSDILRDLKEWKANLPDSIGLLVGDLSATLPRHLVYLHLSINQVSSPVFRMRWVRNEDTFCSHRYLSFAGYLCSSSHTVEYSNTVLTSPSA